MTRLDHVAVMARDLGGLARQYEALGFTLTPLARQSGRLVAEGPVVPWGTANRCAMLGMPGWPAGYLELIGHVDPALPGNGIERFLERHEGMHNLTLGTDDEVAALERLSRAGVDVAGVLHLERPVDSAEPDGLQARFARLPMADAPEGRLQLVRHLSPEAIWQPRFTAHANRAVALEAVILAVERPGETAARLSRLSGLPVVPDAAGGFAVPLEPGLVRVLTADALERVLPGVVPPSLPFMAGVVVRTEDKAAAAREGAALTAVPGGWMAMAGGAAVVFC